MKRRILFLWLLFTSVLLHATDIDLYRFKAPETLPAVIEGHLKIGPSNPDGPIWNCTDRYITRDNKPFMPVMAEMHFSRYPAEEWDEALMKIKAGGVDIVATYLFWIHHEEEEGVFDFTGQRNVRLFLELCKKHDLLVWMRLGPWCHGEVRNGGFPDWLREPFGIEEGGHLGWRQKNPALRSNDPKYMRYVKRLYAAYGEQCEGMMVKDGGPIVGVQVENEYSKRGKGRGADHIATLIETAKVSGFDAPFYSITGWHSAPFPEKVVLPMFGGYPDQPWSGLTTTLAPQQVFRFDLHRDAGGIGTDIFKPTVDSRHDLTPYPLMTCEIGVGIQVTEHRRPWISTLDGVVPPFTRLGIGAGCIGYYVYHGGTNPEGKLSTLQESKATMYPNDVPVKSYDFQAAIRESGRIDEKYHYLKIMHHFMHDFGEILGPTIAILPDHSPESNEDFKDARISLRTDGKAGFLFVNNHVRCYPQPNRYNVQVAVEIGDKEILVPNKPVMVPSGAYFVWPVSMAFDDATLLYSTAQPLMVLENDNEKTYIFKQTITEAPEYLFDAKTIEGDESQFNVTPGLNSLLEVKSKSGKKIRIITLTHAQALQAYKYTFNKQEHLVICDANLAFEKNHIALFSSSESPIKTCIMPSLKLKGESLVQQPSEGSFDMYTVKPQVKEHATPQFESIGENEWKIVTGDLPNRSRLKISYKGNIAELYIGDRLVYDNFYNGEPFEVSLDRFADELKTEALTLKISAMPNKKKLYLDVAMPWGKPTLKSIEIEAEERINLKVK